MKTRYENVITDTPSGGVSRTRSTSGRRHWRPQTLPTAFGLAVAGLFAAGSALAGLNIPNGNPTGAPTAWDPTTQLSIQLKPNPAVFEPQGNCPWLLPALKVAAQPYNNANNVWNYSFATLQGSITLNSYSAWVNNAPAITFGSGGNTVTAPAQAAAGYGGAAFGITYNPTGTDPTTGIKWIQVIAATIPSGRGVTYGTNIGGGLTAYLDNSADNGTGAGVDPYYGWLSGFLYATNQGFLDEPAFQLGAGLGAKGQDWEAQAFMSTETSTVADGVTTHNVTIYDGVWWGFTIVPEPGSATLFAGGAVLVFLARRRSQSRRSAENRGPQVRPHRC
jgi:hypothetical protein